LWLFEVSKSAILYIGKLLTTIFIKSENIEGEIFYLYIPHVISTFYCMLKTLAFLIIFSKSMISYAQLKPIPVPKKPLILNARQEKIQTQNKNCVHKNNLPLKKRLSKFPFNMASTIKIVSFESPNESNLTYLLPIKNKSVDYGKLKEIIALTNIQIESLTDIIYNYGYKGTFYTIEENACIYIPKNAILFLDKNGKTFAFIELCFTCDQYRMSNRRITIGDLCAQKYDLLKMFFNKNGVLYGTQ
jgi:hypothetical protein